MGKAQKDDTLYRKKLGMYSKTFDTYSREKINDINILGLSYTWYNSKRYYTT